MLGKEKEKCSVGQSVGCVVAFRLSAVLWGISFCCLINARGGSESGLGPEETRKNKATHSTVHHLTSSMS